MKLLLVFDRALSKVEAFLLALSLALMLLFSLYSVAYRNMVAPVVLWLQGRASEQQAFEPGTRALRTTRGSMPAARDTGQGREADIKPAPKHEKPAAGPGEAPVDDDGAYLGDLADEAPAPAAATPPDDDGAYLGDLADEAPAPAAAPPPEDDGAYLGDLVDDGPAPVAATPPEDDGAYLGDLVDDGPAAVPSGRDEARPDDRVRGEEPARIGPRPPSGFGAPHREPWLLRLLKFFNFAWIDLVTRHLLLWVAFLGAALATRRRKHINIDALSRLISLRAKLRLRILLDLVAAVICLFLTHAAWKFLMSESAAGGVFYKWIPSWVGIGIIPVGFGLLALHFCFEVLLGIGSIRGFPGPGDVMDPEGAGKEALSGEEGP